MAFDETVAIFAPSLMRELSRAPGIKAHEAGNLGEKRIRALRRWEKSLLQMSLYADEIWLPAMHRYGMSDSLVVEEGHNPASVAIHYEYHDLIRENHEEIQSVLRRLEPLIDAAIIRFYNPYEVYYEHVAEPLFGSRRGYTPDEFANAWPDTFVAEGLLFASALGKPYTALTRDEEQVIGKAVGDIRTLSALEGRIALGLVKMELPGFDTDPQSLADARKDEETFYAFRSTIRSMFRQMNETEIGPNFEREIRQLRDDVVIPELTKLNEQCSRIRSLGNFSRSGAITFSAGAIASLATASLAGLGVAGITFAAEILLKLLFAKPEPSAQFFNRIQVAGSPLPRA
jgi:hypothetical protein